MLKIKEVYEQSIAREMGLSPGDVILKINGERAIDIIDYLFFESRETLELSVLKAEGKVVQYALQKGEEEPLGIEFEADGLGVNRGCVNNCIFCFVDQLPEGMRSSLYFKDDDWRLSFVVGNYVTLTNVSEAEFQRILRRKPSPLNISVHATDEVVRTFLLGNQKSGLMNRLHSLKKAGIMFNCQAVLCKGINDGPVLEKTILELSALMPNALSLALVPVGLTGHREGLPGLQLIDEKTAGEIIGIAEKWQKRLLKECGRRFVFCADELYIKAKKPFPPAEEYEGFMQLEDGVGLVALFRDELASALSEAGRAKYARLSLLSGVDAAPYLREAADKIKEKMGAEIAVHPIKNAFFGESITVTGLITGGDIIRELKGKELGEALILPKVMLRQGEDTFLDGVTIPDVEQSLGVKCIPVGADAYSLVEMLEGQEN